MDIQRETVVEAGVSLVAVVIFIAAALVVGTTFRANGHLSNTGGLAMVGVILLFVAVMTGIGYWLAYQE